MTKMTKKQAREIIDQYMDLTGYAGKYCATPLTVSQMHDIFRSCEFGYPETRVIIAALVMAGAKFENDLDLLK